MAEPKRVPLLPVKATSNGKISPQKDQSFEKIQDEDEETIRLEISLGDSTEKACPEFSYVQKIKGQLKKTTKLDQSKSLDPLEEDDSGKLEALAKKFEEKYGPKPDAAGKKRKHGFDPLYHDFGYGYDESDPFVDNSEAYDELIPSNWTTQHGGFYINQGELRFKTNSDEEAKDFKSPKRKKLGSSEKKKLKIKSDEKLLSKTPKELSTQKRKKQLLIKEKHQKKLEKAVLQQKEKKHKKTTSLDSPAKVEKTNLTPKTENILGQKLTKISKDESSFSIAKSNESSIVTSPDAKHFKKPFVKLENVPTSKVDRDEKLLVNNDELIARKQFIKDALANTAGSESQKTHFSPDKQREITVKSEEISPSSKDDETVGPPQLPENLPLILEAGIQNLKEAARNGSNGKCRFFDMSVNKTLLSVARSLAKLPCKLRTTTYDYLAFYLPCSKETLLKRAKTLMIEHQVNQLDEPMMKLKEAIEKAMPQQKKTYDAAVANALTEQVREQMKQNGFPMKTDQENSELHNESQESLNSNEQPMTPTESGGKKNIPKRKFSWSDEVRDLLCEVVSIKVQLFKMSKSRSMTAEEYIKDFLENDVRKLWPKGWMTSRILFKESKAAHQEITQPANKVKKVAKKPEPPATSVVSQKASMPFVAKNMFSTPVTTEQSPHLAQKMSDSKVFQYPSKASSMPKTVPASSPKPYKSVHSASSSLQKSNNNEIIFKTKSLDKKDTLTAVTSKHRQTVTSHQLSGGITIKKEPHQKSVTTDSNREATIAVGRSFNASSKQDNKPTLNPNIDNQHVKHHSPVISEKAALNLGSRIRSILDYAAGSSGVGKGDSTDHIKAPKPVASSSTSYPERCVSYSKMKSEPIYSGSMLPESAIKKEKTETVWRSKSTDPHSFSHSTTSLSRSLSSSVPSAKKISPPKHANSDAALQHVFATKHTSHQSSSIFNYKSPAKELQRSKSTTPPKNSVKNISPQHNTSPASTRTSPLVHYPSGLDGARRMSGHSPESIRGSPVGISYSVSRMTKESPNKPTNMPASQHASFDSMPFSAALSSLSSALASSSHQVQSMSRDHSQSLAAMQQAKQLPSQAELLYRQQQQQQQQQLQQHLKQQTLLQQQQLQLQKQQMQQRVSSISNPNLLENLGSSSNPECYPNPFPNFRPQFS